MRTQIALKSLEDDQASLDIELELDRERKVVTLHMLEFDAGHITSFLVQTLPHEYRIRVDDSLFQHVLKLPRNDLVIALAGRRHQAHIAHLSNGRVAIRLGDPDAEYLGKCRRAIEQLLPVLHDIGIEAVVTGIDACRFKYSKRIILGSLDRGWVAALCEKHDAERAASETEGGAVTTVGLKRMLSRLPDLTMDLTIDHERQLVTLTMLQFDSGLLAHYVMDILPRDFAVVVAEDDEDIDEAWLPRRPAYRLVVVLAGREHPAQVVRLRDGSVTIALGDPDAVYLAKCWKAIQQLLTSLHFVGIEAVVTGIDRYGRPEPTEDYLHLYAKTQGRGQDEAVERLAAEVEVLHDVSICVLSHYTRPDDFASAIAREAHFAWDPEAREVVRRNWDAP